jgi:hypothetical protein
VRRLISHFCVKFGSHRQAQNRQGRRIAQFIASIADQFEGLLQTLHQASGSHRRTNLPAFADKQRHAQLFLQLADLMADCAVGNTQLGCRPAEMCMTGGAFEGSEGSQ